ncbi:MAG: helix-turn-helix domain-containing protein [Bdellovibrionales bacterium]|nr:helix-turn-helix domain-containing protein [Bdellovibrionales bacterium]
MQAFQFIIVSPDDPPNGTLNINSQTSYCGGHRGHPRGVQKSLEPIDKTTRDWLSVKELAMHYKLSKSLIYALIQTEPDFPVQVFGRKKKYMVKAKDFSEWIEKRSSQEKTERFALSSAEELLKRYKK